MIIDPAIIDKAAQALHEAGVGKREWYELNSDAQEMWRDDARAALQAVADDLARQAVADALAPFRDLLDEWETHGAAVHPDALHQFRAAIEAAERNQP